MPSQHYHCKWGGLYWYPPFCEEGREASGYRNLMSWSKNLTALCIWPISIARVAADLKDHCPHVPHLQGSTRVVALVRVRHLRVHRALRHHPQHPGRQFNRNIFGSSFSLKNHLRFHFDSVTCLNYPFLNFLSVQRPIAERFWDIAFAVTFYCECDVPKSSATGLREYQAKTQVVFQAKIKATISLLNLASSSSDSPCAATCTRSPWPSRSYPPSWPSSTRSVGRWCSPSGGD